MRGNDQVGASLIKDLLLWPVSLCEPFPFQKQKIRSDQSYLDVTAWVVRSLQKLYSVHNYDRVIIQKLSCPFQAAISRHEVMK